ncbi:MAG: hypothetical protein E6I70_05535 [Chloroflexi bacterium]|nr:MAG: hypothetical protein E6I70_05535 [Chloroflexota bacterium]
MREILERGRLAPMCTVAIAIGVLDALAALHQAGVWHGALHAGNVRVAADGTIRLGDRDLTARGEQAELKLQAADVQAVGALIWPSRAAESPLGLYARRLVRGTRGRRSTGYATIQARLALWEVAGRLATQRIQAQARQRLGELVTGAPAKVSPPLRGPARAKAPVSRISPAVPIPPVAPVRAIALPTKARSAARPVPTLALAGLVGAVVAAVFALSTLPVVGAPLSAHPAPANTEKPMPSSSLIDEPLSEAALARAAGTPRPQVPIPALAPASAGQVTAVKAGLAAGACAPGSICQLHVEVWVQPSGRARGVSWSVKSVDLCSGAVQDLGGGAFTAQPGWTHVASENGFDLPEVKAQALVVVSETPDRAASAPLVLGNRGAAC